MVKPAKLSASKANKTKLNWMTRDKSWPFVCKNFFFVFSYFKRLSNFIERECTSHSGQ